MQHYGNYTIDGSVEVTIPSKRRVVKRSEEYYFADGDVSILVRSTYFISSSCCLICQTGRKYPFPYPTPCACQPVARMAITPR
jgi:hypothetical protein